jgi:hypothetical protein
MNPRKRKLAKLRAAQKPEPVVEEIVEPTPEPVVEKVEEPKKVKKPRTRRSTKKKKTSEE